MGNLFAKNDTEIDIPEEELEELRMYTTFHVKEIGRLHIEFLRMTKGTGWLTKEAFLRIPCIEANPLRDRICLCFGYSEDDIIVKPPDDRNRNESEHDGSIENSDEDVDECADNINNAHENKNIKKVKHSVESSKSRVDVKNSRGIEDNNALRIGSEATTDSGIDGDADSNKSPAIGAFNKEIEEEDGSKLNFRKFLIGISLFNSYGRLEEKLKLAFRLQDFDNDDIISREGRSLL